MFYINTETLQYPVTEGAIRAALTNTSFPAPFIPPTPYARVEDGIRPECNRLTHYLKEGAPSLQDGVWRRSWTVEAYSAEEAAKRLEQERQQQSAQVRTDRNLRLSACDWTQVDDAPVDKAAWATYRQALRDVTSQTEFPFNVSWPQEPAA